MKGLFAEGFGQLVLDRLGLRVLVFDDHEARIVRWIESSATEKP